MWVRSFSWMDPSLSWEVSPSGSDGGDSSSRQPHDGKTNKGDVLDPSVMARFRVLKERLDTKDHLGNSSHEHPYEMKIIRPREIDASVMARLRVLKGRIENLDSDSAKDYPEHLHLAEVGGQSGTNETVCSCPPGSRNDVGQKYEPVELADVGIMWQNQQMRLGGGDSTNKQYDEGNTKMVDAAVDITMASYNILKRRLDTTNYLGKCSHKQRHEVNMNQKDEVDAFTMAKLDVLKGRRDYSNSGYAGQPELVHFSDVGGDSSNRQYVEGNTMMVDVIDDITIAGFNALKRQLDATNYLADCSHKQRHEANMNGVHDVDASTMARLEVPKERRDYSKSG
ncbi:uncharacterized protein [Typha angustifolia]|uniref:uncharacterized protein isoform X1 n=1 Tax=Typha angustifolia TaxID=59011 RepID=UPI003C305045